MDGKRAIYVDGKPAVEIDGRAAVYLAILPEADGAPEIRLLAAFCGGKPILQFGEAGVQ